MIWFKIAGGLALFYIGLRLFGDALKHFQDPSWLQVLDNPWIMCAAALGLTLVVQSSSITTSILIATVAAGHLSLAGAIGGIIGANIGTTITAWIAAAVFGMEATARQAAIAHTFLNVTMALLALPFARQLAIIIGRF